MSLSGSAVAMIWEGHAADAEPIFHGREFGLLCVCEQYDTAENVMEYAFYEIFA